MVDDDMKTRGFTLIELVAVVAILAVIFFVTFPNINNIIRNDNEKKYKDMVNDLCSAGKSYIYSNLDMYNDDFIENNIITLDINSLMFEGVVSKTTENPKTKKSVRKDILEYRVLNDKSLECTYKTNN